ncbi:retropepsin-like aspartic protease [Symbiobacterium thermophilum]|uniref:Peptidase A2 domain-containing protein n=1 Tax=Symbiobacterium thermophilum TaxID=2734 RepID=A0A953HZ70_SYMTR|nr:retropepsin-like aspartic protease [Symbiobacterium thermophilum]MBY6274650.1 hypothetical protein [Symbiobacterium thermophilum]
MEFLLLYDLHLFAQVEVAGQKRLANIDTGANIDLAFGVFEGVEMLDGEEGPVHGAVGEVRLRSGRVPDVRLLDEQVGPLQVAISDENGYEKHPFPVSMRLGAKTLLSRPLLLDFKGLRMGRERLPDSYPRVAAPLEFVCGVPFVEIELGGRRLRALFDTAAGMSVLNTAHLDDLGLRPEVLYETQATDSSGTTVTLPVGRTRGLQIGGLALGDCEYLMLDLSAIEEIMGTCINLGLGLNTLLASSTVWYLDPQAGRVQVTDVGLPA